jgi:hypothetical protein
MTVRLDPRHCEEQSDEAIHHHDDGKTRDTAR